MDCERAMITNAELYLKMASGARHLKHASYEEQLRFDLHMERGITLAFLIWLNLLSIFALSVVCRIDPSDEEWTVIYTGVVNFTIVAFMDLLVIYQELLMLCYPRTTTTTKKEDPDNDLICPLLP